MVTFRNILPIVVLLALSCVSFGKGQHSDAIQRSISVIAELNGELESRGTDLVIVRMPVRPELYELKTDAFDDPKEVEELHLHTVQGQEAEAALEAAGIPVINLYPDIRRESLLSDIFQADRFHFTPEGEARIAAILAGKLKEEGFMMQPGETRDVVFMGECFAESFAGALVAADTEDKLTVLNKNGGGALVHNYLFVFPDEYLTDKDLVVWVFTDRLFMKPDFALLDPDPGVPTDAAPKTKSAKMTFTTQLERGDETEFDYPDALRASVFEVEETGEKFIGIDQIMKDRQITLGRKVRVGNSVRMKIVPWSSWVRAHPELVKLYLIDDVSLEDFDLPRYWIEDWLVEDG